MAKLAVPFLLLSMLTTSLLLTPIVTPVEAATTDTTHVKKKVRVTHRSQRVATPQANPYSNNPYDNDFDRKNAGGGGGY